MSTLRDRIQAVVNEWRFTHGRVDQKTMRPLIELLEISNHELPTAIAFVRAAMGVELNEEAVCVLYQGQEFISHDTGYEMLLQRVPIKSITDNLIHTEEFEFE